MKRATAAVTLAAVVCATATALAVGTGANDDGDVGGAGPAAARPPGDDLRAAPASLETACRRAASKLDGTLVCPPRVPRGRLRIDGAGSLNKTSVRRRLGYLLDLRSPSLSGAEGGHWTVAGGTDPSLASLTRDALTRERAHLAGQPVEVLLMRPYDQGGGLYGDHVVVEWESDGITQQVSVHGARHRRVALAVAEAMIRRQRSCARQPRAGCAS